MGWIYAWHRISGILPNITAGFHYSQSNISFSLYKRENDPYKTKHFVSWSKTIHRSVFDILEVGSKDVPRKDEWFSNMAASITICAILTFGVVYYHDRIRVKHRQNCGTLVIKAVCLVKIIGRLDAPIYKNRSNRLLHLLIQL